MDWTTKLTQTEILDVFIEELKGVGGEVQDMQLPDKLVQRSVNSVALRREVFRCLGVKRC